MYISHNPACETKLTATHEVRADGTVRTLLAALLLATAGCISDTPASDDPPVSASCPPSASQPAAGQGIAVDCAITGAMANQIINPLNPEDSSCGVQSHTLFDQSVSAAARIVVGADGVDTNAITKIVGTIAPTGSHTASLGKSAPPACAGTIGIIVPVSTTFGGDYMAFVDKVTRPMCIQESGLMMQPFTQSVQVGLSVNIDAATREATQRAVHRQTDLAVAVAVNELLAPDAALNNAFRNRAGRCSGNWISVDVP